MKTIDKIIGSGVSGVNRNGFKIVSHVGFGSGQNGFHKLPRCISPPLNNKNNALDWVVGSFIGSAALAVIAHTTEILNRFSEPIGGAVKLALDSIALFLGTLVTAGMLTTEDHSLDYP